MPTEESKKIWKLRFVDRTHDSDFYIAGNEADPTLQGRVYNLTWDRTPKMKDAARHKNAMEISRRWVLWLGFETLCDSPMLEKYR